MLRVVKQIRTVLSTDIDQNDILINGLQTIDDTSPVDQSVVVIKLPAVGVSYIEVPKPPTMTSITYLTIETDAPILCRLNTADGTSGTEIPISPLLTPALSQVNPVPSPQVTPSVQKGVWDMRAGGSTDANTVLLTRVWLKNPGVSPATIKVTMIGE